LRRLLPEELDVLGFLVLDLVGDLCHRAPETESAAIASAAPTVRSVQADSTPAPGAQDALLAIIVMNDEFVLEQPSRSQHGEERTEGRLAAQGSMAVRQDGRFLSRRRWPNLGHGSFEGVLPGGVTTSPRRGQRVALATAVRFVREGQQTLALVVRGALGAHHGVAAFTRFGVAGITDGHCPRGTLGGHVHHAGGHQWTDAVHSVGMACLRLLLRVVAWSVHDDDDEEGEMRRKRTSALPFSHGKGRKCRRKKHVGVSQRKRVCAA
jgi:hypothetical protein